MNKQVVIAGAIALVIASAIVGGILYSTRHNKVEVKAEVLKVRSHQVDKASTIVAVDFRIMNPSTQQFVVREVEVFLDTTDSKSLKGDVFAEVDAQRMFDYYKVLGAKYNATLVRREKIDSGQAIDRMILVRFDASDPEVHARKALRLIVHDIDGSKSEVVEVRK